MPRWWQRKKEVASSSTDIEVYPQLRQEDNGGSSMQSFKHTNTATGQEEVYHVVTSAYFQKTNEDDEGKLLNIKPMWYLRFYVEEEKPSSSCIILTNKTDDYVAFMIQKTQPLKFSVRPNKGLLLPRSTCQVIVTMEAQKVVSPEEYIIDLVEIQSVKSKNNSYSTDDFSSAFKKRWGNTIYRCKMAAHYSCPRDRHPSVQDHYAELANKGLVHQSEKVISIETHQTKPWLLLNTSCSVCIWNYETRTEEKSFEVNDSTILKNAKFIHKKQWIVVGIDNGCVCLFDYNTLEKVKEFKAHEGYTWCLAVHPTLSVLLTTSSDNLIKLWNWENDWVCDQTFEGSSQDVTEVAFNPEDSRSFASVSREGINIWSFGSSVAEFTIKANIRRFCCVEYFIGTDNKLYLLCGSCNDTADVWDYESKTLVQTLKAHLHHVTTTLVPSELPIIITGSTDKTICIWNKNTYRLELVWNCDLGEVYSMRYIKASDEIVLGCQDGMIVIKIVNTSTRLDKT